MEGIVVLEDKTLSSQKVKVYEKTKGYIAQITTNESFKFEFYSSNIELIFVAEGFPSVKQSIDFNERVESFVRIELKVQELSEIVISAKRKEVFLLKRMEDFEQTEIYAGKKK